MKGSKVPPFRWVALLGLVMMVAVYLLLLQALDMQRYAVPRSPPPDNIWLFTTTDTDHDVPLSPSSPKPPPLLSNHDNISSKPTIFLHYGPAKTGTSTLQSEMTAWKDRMWHLDNVLYVGAYYHANGSFAGRLPLHKQFMDPKLVCSTQMAHERVAWEQEIVHNETLATRLQRNVACLHPMLSTLAAYHANGTSLFFSNEVKSTMTAWKALPGYQNAQVVVSQDWKSWHTLLSRDWNFVLILGHRPYLDWFPSAKTQVDKFTPSKPRLANWPEKGGGRLRTLFPPDVLVSPHETLWEVTDDQLFNQQDFHSVPPKLVEDLKHHWDQNTHPFLSSQLIHEWSKEFIPVQFLHLFDAVPLRTNLLCHILPTPRSCKASMSEDAEGASELAHLNEGKTYIDRIWYDQLATSAVDHGLVQAHTISRGKLTEACRHFHEVILSNRTLLDLPHKCPHAQSLLALWQVSWQMEHTMLGNAANRTLHAQLFRRNLATGKYCNLDSQRALQQEEWQSFFQGIAAKG